MESRKLLLVQNNDGKNPSIIELHEPFEFQRLELVEYTISGVPTTSGIPDNLFTWVLMEGIRSQPILTNGPIFSSGFPVLLTAPTTNRLNDPPELVTNIPNKIKQKFHIELLNPDGTRLLFDKYVFKFMYK